MVESFHEQGFTYSCWMEKTRQKEEQRSKRMRHKNLILRRAASFFYRACVAVLICLDVTKNQSIQTIGRDRKAIPFRAVHAGAHGRPMAGSQRDLLARMSIGQLSRKVLYTDQVGAYQAPHTLVGHWAWPI
jgi:hypothetical protein